MAISRCSNSCNCGVRTPARTLCSRVDGARHIKAPSLHDVTVVSTPAILHQLAHGSFKTDEELSGVCHTSPVARGIKRLSKDMLRFN